MTKTQLVAALAEKMDADKDGKLTSDEMAAAAKGKKGGKKGKKGGKKGAKKPGAKKPGAK